MQRKQRLELEVRGVLKPRKQKNVEQDEIDLFDPLEMMFDNDNNSQQEVQTSQTLDVNDIQDESQKTVYKRVEIEPVDINRVSYTLKPDRKGRYTISELQKTTKVYLKENLEKFLTETLKQIIYKDATILYDKKLVSRVINGYVTNFQDDYKFKVLQLKTVDAIQQFSSKKNGDANIRESISSYEKSVNSAYKTLEQQITNDIDSDTFSYDNLLELPMVAWTTVDSLYLAIKYHDKLDEKRIRAFIEWQVFKGAAESKSQLWLTKTDIFQNVRTGLDLGIMHRRQMNKLIEDKILNDSNVIIKLDKSEIDLDVEDDIYASKTLYNKFENVFAKIESIKNYKHNIKKPTDKHIKDIIGKVEEEQGFEYSDEQNKALRDMLNNNVFFLQGVAGSGKTSVLRGFVQLIRKLYPNNKIYGTSFTGKASANLGKMAHLESNEWSTMHLWLALNMFTKRNGEIHYYGQQIPTFEQVDVLIIDEVPMLSLDMIAKIISYVDVSTKVIFVGDLAQLPPIKISVMNELTTSNVVPQVELKKLNRSDSQEINDVANSVRNSEYPEVMMNDIQTDVFSYEDVRQSSFEDDVIAKYESYLDKGETQDSIRILANMNKLVGNLNSTIQDILKSRKLLDTSKNSFTKKDFKTYKDIAYYVGDRVIATKNENSEEISTELIPRNRVEQLEEYAEHKYANDPDKASFGHKLYYNGAIGTIIDVIPSDEKTRKKQNSTFMTSAVIIDFDDFGIAAIAGDAIYQFDLGYAMTIHKSQGSTIPHVIGMLGYAPNLNTRQLVYTMVSRSSKTLDLLGQSSVYQHAIDNDYYQEAHNIYKFVMNDLKNNHDATHQKTKRLEISEDEDN